MKIFFPHYFQLEKADCGAACLKMITKYYGKSIKHNTLRELCETHIDGISISNIIKAGEYIGFRSVSFEVTFEQLIKKAILPCIARVENNHYVVIYKINRTHIYISDPAKGKVKYSLNTFKGLFISKEDERGIVIFFEPQPLFYNTDHIGRKNQTAISYLRILIKYVSFYSVQLRYLMLIMLLITAMQSFIPFIFRSIIDIGINRNDYDFLYIILTANVILVTSIAFASFVKDWITKHIGTRLATSMISNYLITLLDMPQSYFDTRTKGDILNTVKDHEKIKDFIMNNVVGSLYAGLTFIIFSVILYYFESKLFLIFIFSSAIYLIWIFIFLRLQEKIDWSFHVVNSQERNFWVETLSNISDIKICNYERKRRLKWEHLQLSNYTLTTRSLKLKSLQHTGGQIINGLRNISMTFFCAFSVMEGNMTIGAMISVQIISGFLNSPIQQIILFIQGYTSAKTSFTRLNNIHIIGNHDKLNIQEHDFILPEDKTIVLKRLYFKYPNNDFYSLKDISLVIPYGNIIALVGKSGSGKSSLIKILLRLYSINNGELSISNLPLNNFPLRKWSSLCAAVLQDSNVMNDSLLNNIVLDDPQINSKRLDEIITCVELNELIKELPLGFNTIIEGDGRKLSQGQKQRILIARALYQDPYFLFLDEATSGLDIFSETIILQNIKKYMKGRTVLIATHKISSIQDANNIIVLNNGMVIESGSHEELMQKKKQYYYSYMIQNQETKRHVKA